MKIMHKSAGSFPDVIGLYEHAVNNFLIMGDICSIKGLPQRLVILVTMLYFDMKRLNAAIYF